MRNWATLCAASRCGISSYPTYTSIVAVDTSEAADGSGAVTVHQAVPVPEGVNYETTVEQGRADDLSTPVRGGRTQFEMPATRNFFEGETK